MNHRDPAAPLWWGTIGLRLVTLAFACAVLLVQLDRYQRPGLAVAVFSVMCVWSGVSSVCYARGFRRSWLVVTDAGVTCALVLTSPLALSAAQYAAAAPLVTTVWAAVPPVVAGARFGAGGGVLGGLAVAVATGFAQLELDLDVARDGVLLIVSGLLVGAAATTARRSRARLAEALRTEAATSERDRLARSIHDNVLQVLARVRSQGAELGGEAGELARVAGEQEIALRSLVSTGAPEQYPNGHVDLGAALRVLATDRVQVSAPAGEVTLPSAASTELLAATKEALANVDRHAGSNARAWVLLEDLGDEVVVTVCDDGPGIPDGALEAAAARGHLGVRSSIRGRIDHLGGTATLETGPSAGTEWELRLPRRRLRIE